MHETGITFPPLRTMKLEFQGVHIGFSSAVTGNGVQFDSMQEVLFILNGEIVYQRSASVVMFDPAKRHPGQQHDRLRGELFHDQFDRVYGRLSHRVHHAERRNGLNQQHAF